MSSAFPFRAFATDSILLVLNVHMGSIAAAREEVGHEL